MKHLRLRHACATLLSAAVLLVAVGTGSANAAPVLAVSIATSVSTAASGAPIEYRVAYSVGVENLVGGYLEVELPETQFRTYRLQRTGGVSSSVSTPGPILVRYQLGDIAAGTSGEVILRASTLQVVLDNATTVAPTAVRLGGASTPAVSADPVPRVTITARAYPSFSNRVIGYASAPSPADGSTPGYDITYEVQLGNVCGGDNTFVENEGCHSLRGAVGLDTPTQGIMRAIEQLGPLPPYQPIPAGVLPWGPAVPSLPTTGTVTLSHFGQVSTTLTSGPGVVWQGSYPAQAVTDSVARWRISSGNAPRLRVRVWVPLPAGTQAQHALTARLVGSAADNGVPVDLSRTATATVYGRSTVSLVAAVGSSTPLGSGMSSYSLVAFDPVTPNALSRYSIPNRGDLAQGDYVFRIGAVGPVVEATVTTVIPPGVNVAAVQTPTGWTASYTLVAGCGASTPDSDFTTTSQPGATCVRVRNPLLTTAQTDIHLGVTRDPAVILAPGEVSWQEFSSTLVSVNASTLSARIRIPIVNHVQLSGAVSPTPAFGLPGSAVTLSATSTLQGYTSDFGPRNWSLVVTLPGEFVYTGFRVIQPPAGLTAGAVSCALEPATRRVTCTAAGDAAYQASGNDAFRVALLATVRPGAPAASVPIPVCAFNATNDGPQDAAGNSMAYVQSTADRAPGPDTAFIPCRDNARFQIDSVPVIGLSGALTGPSTVAAGGVTAYRWTVAHLPGSTSDLVQPYLYDLLGRDGGTPAPAGDVLPRFVSASTSTPGEISYTCDADPTYARAGALTWVSSPTQPPCTGAGAVSGVRYRLDSITYPAGNPGYYAVGDPPAVVTITVAMPLDTPDGRTFVVQSLLTSAQVSGVRSSPLVVTTDSNADLSIRLASTTEPVRGQPTTVDVSVVNLGPDATVAPVVVRLTAPSGSTPDAAASGNAEWTCTASGQQLTCTRVAPLSVGPGGSTFPVVLVVDQTPPAPALTSNASVTSTHTDPDPANNTAVLTVVLDVGPVARADGVVARPSAAVVVDLLANDAAGSAALDPATARVVPVTGPDRLDAASVSIDPDTAVATIAPLGRSGRFLFTYEICDANMPVSLCSSADVVVDVIAGPTAADDLGTTVPGVAITVPVLDNDVPGGFPLDPTSLSLVGVVSGGTATVGGTGVAFVPDPGFAGRVVVNYRVCDVGTPVECDIGVATIDVAPAALDDAVQGTLPTVTFDPTANDVVPDGYTISVGPPASGRLIVNPDRTVTFVGDSAGIVTATYTVCDPVTGLCDTAVITLTMVAAPTGSITGVVFVDGNANGLAEDAETVSGVRVSSINAGPDGMFGTADDITLPSVVTASPYLLPGVPLGRVLVSLDRSTLPQGLRPADDSDGGTDAAVLIQLTAPGAYRADFRLVATPPPPLRLASTGADMAAGLVWAGILVLVGILLRARAGTASLGGARAPTSRGKNGSS